MAKVMEPPIRDSRAPSFLSGVWTDVPLNPLS